MTSSVNYWMPFTANRRFHQKPRVFTKAKGMYYTCEKGNKILDATSGLWCVGLGHGREQITKAVKNQLETLDYSPAFQASNPVVVDLAKALCKHTPKGLKKVFFTCSGSEAVESALKIALAFFQLQGKTSKKILIGRKMGYHGVNFGGMSVGAIESNRKQVDCFLPNVLHLDATCGVEKNLFSLGEPPFGGEQKAAQLLSLIQRHGAENIAAVILEPVAGSAGVLVPPKGYLQRIRQICTEHDILLIFDEVITGFGRLGSPFASNHFNIVPDIITCAKGLTNGCIPMGAVFVQNALFDCFMQKAPKNAIEFFHGYTYSGHPVAAAAALASLKIFEQEGLFFRASEGIEKYWQQMLHNLKDSSPWIYDIRNIGLMGAIELFPRKNQPGERGFEVYQKAYEQGLLIRTTADTIALSPPLIVNEQQIDFIGQKLSAILKTLS